MNKKRISGIRWIAIAIPMMAALSLIAAPGRSAANQAAARRQFKYAEGLKTALGKKLGGMRTVPDYMKVVEAYQRVGLLTPSAKLVAPSLMEIARLYRQMGHLFHQKYFQKAVDTYQHLVREYPRSRYAPIAIYAIANLEQGRLGHPALARKSLETLIAQYPSSDQADAARLTLVAHPHLGESKTGAEQSASAQPEAARRRSRTEQRGREENSARRISARGESARDLAAAASGLKPVTVSVHGGEASRRMALVRRVFIEQTLHTTAVVILLSGPVKYRSAEIEHPERIFFDLSRAYLTHPHGETLTLHSQQVHSVRVAQNEPSVVRVVLDVDSSAGYSASLLRNPYRLVIRVGRLNGSARGAALNSLPARGNLTPAQPLPSGHTSLVRALGLKIDRIVIDPGHGGFDTGTIGPNGLEEKTIALDIALRLGRLIQKRLPGTQVIYTRDRDVFVPLEERTRIANKEKADLFISIHANSSSDRSARGVTVYYLNFTTSPGALAVAARENALAQVPVHKLQSLLQKISLNDKIEESKDFAADVDHSLYDELHRFHVHTDNRGVRKAPFVVLIGAHMPSILAEVSFLSNPREDHLLTTGRYREQIALGLFKGIKRYLTGLNSLSSTFSRQADSNRR
jgi:N-acetylmuramoyl-L-alanine amidase